MASGIPILMYHKVGAEVQTKADTFLNVSARDFARQMRLLQRMGFRGVTQAEAASRLRSGSPGEKLVCVTFDDGHQNVFDHAAPVLDSLGWPATVFVPTAYVGGRNDWDRETGKPLLPIMDWDALRTLQDRGWEMAGHTRSHPHLDQLPDAEAAIEIAQGRRDIEERLGKAERTFCYPFGGLNERTPGLVQKAGFTAACTTKSGLGRPSTDPFLLPRVKVAYRDGLLGFFYRLRIRPLMK
jgi:peptidoglycan/xylan/chitin deacetylase (PgdA/CDA1 family)